MKITITRDTVVKAAPIPSGELDDSQRESIPMGETFDVDPFDRYDLERGHLKITLREGKTIDGRSTVYLFVGHTDVDLNTLEERHRDLTKTQDLGLDEDGLNLIKYFEGCHTRKGDMYEPYRCPAGVWTVGYGHTLDVDPELLYSKAECDMLLRADLENFETSLQELIGDLPSSPQQFNAFLAFAFNCGIGALANSTAFRLFSQGNIDGAADALMMWCKVNDTVFPGLLKRRMCERAMFLNQQWEPVAKQFDRGEFDYQFA